MLHDLYAELMILRPTRGFADLLNAVLLASGNEKKVSFDLLKTDATVYIVPHYDSPKEAADALYKRYQTMFEHEFLRWFFSFNKSILKKLSFFDFYVCFNFDYHMHILNLMEPKKTDHLILSANNCVLTLKPKPALKIWMEQALKNEQDIFLLKKLSLDQIAENATSVVKDFQNLSEIQQFLKNNAQTILEFELARMCSKKKLWPAKRDWEQLKKFFEFEIHTNLVNMLED